MTIFRDSGFSREPEDTICLVFTLIRTMISKLKCFIKLDMKVATESVNSVFADRLNKLNTDSLHHVVAQLVLNISTTHP